MKINLLITEIDMTGRIFLIDADAGFFGLSDATKVRPSTGYAAAKQNVRHI